MTAVFATAAGQTNTSLAPAAWFSLPSPQLLKIATALEASIEDIPPVEFDAGLADPTLTADTLTIGEWSSNSPTPPTSDPDVLPDRTESDLVPGEFDYQTYRLVHASGFLERKEPENDDLFSRLARNIFEPEIFRVGRTTVCCSVLTAIKRKNPLCLLNPMVLNVSW